MPSPAGAAKLHHLSAVRHSNCTCAVACAACGGWRRRQVANLPRLPPQLGRGGSMKLARLMWAAFALAILSTVAAAQQAVPDQPPSTQQPAADQSLAQPPTSEAAPEQWTPPPTYVPPAPPPFPRFGPGPRARHHSSVHARRHHLRVRHAVVHHRHRTGRHQAERHHHRVRHDHAVRHHHRTRHRQKITRPHKIRHHHRRRTR